MAIVCLWNKQAVTVLPDGLEDTSLKVEVLSDLYKFRVLAYWCHVHCRLRVLKRYSTIIIQLQPCLAKPITCSAA